MNDTSECNRYCLVSEQSYFDLMIERLEPFLQFSHYTSDTIVYKALTDEGEQYVLVADLENYLESISLVEQYKGYDIRITVATKELVC